MSPTLGPVTPSKCSCPSCKMIVSQHLKNVSQLNLLGLNDYVFVGETILQIQKSVIASCTNTYCCWITLVMDDCTRCHKIESRCFWSTTTITTTTTTYYYYYLLLTATATATLLLQLQLQLQLQQLQPATATATATAAATTTTSITTTTTTTCLFFDYSCYFLVVFHVFLRLSSCLCGCLGRQLVHALRFLLLFGMLCMLNLCRHFCNYFLNVAFWFVP